MKWFARPGAGQPSLSVSIEPEPRVLASSMDERQTTQAAPRVIAWVQANHEALRRFWFEGETLMADDFVAFLDGLRRL